MHRILRLVLVFTGLAFAAQAMGAGDIAGNYRCRSYNVSGGGGSCRIAPPLVLEADGSYQMSRERGTYKVKGDRIELSESKIRGPGRLESDNRIVFEYDYGGRHHFLTYQCLDCRR